MEIFLLIVILLGVSKLVLFPERNEIRKLYENPDNPTRHIDAGVCTKCGRRPKRWGDLCNTCEDAKFGF